jgi:heterodisulfide reductase subunit C
LRDVIESGRKVTVGKLPEKIVPKPSLRKKIEDLSRQEISACFQCEKCTNGCPVTFAMDVAPHRMMRMLQLGLLDEALRSDTIWVCASCETCSTRCPNDIDIAHVMDTLRQLAQREGIKAAQKNVSIFHSAFLSSLRRHGRVHEPEMAMVYTLKSGGLGGLRKQAGTGIDMLKRGKIKILPSRVRTRRQVNNIFKKVK